MKNKSRKSVPVILAIAAVTAVIAAQPAKAVSAVGYTLNLTEFSSLSLTATYNGPGATFSVLNTNPDQWTVTGTLTQNSTFLFNPSFVIDWIEPEDPNEVNEVSHGVQFGNNDLALYVVSDESLMEYGGDFSTLFPNGALVQVGTDNGQPVFLRFDDRAALPETPVTVPDTGSTLTFLAFSGIGCVALARFRRLQVA